MLDLSVLRLRPTTESDLDFVLATESHPDNIGFIKQWSREQHFAAMQRTQQEHWIVESISNANRLGYIIAYDLTSEHCGVYLKRIALNDKNKGVGRTVVSLFSERAFLNANVPYVWLCVFPDNLRGKRCYEAAGYSDFSSEVDERDQHSLVAEGLPAGDMVLMRRYR